MASLANGSKGYGCQNPSLHHRSLISCLTELAPDSELRASNTKCVIYKPPVQPMVAKGPSVFLAGSIEMGVAEDWQIKLTSALSHLPITIFNPRRDKWDASWGQDISNVEFKGQVEWELDQLERSDVIALFFDPDTKSPISLLELGLHAKTNKLIVCCPTGFWRRGNVQIVCEKYGILCVETWEELTECVKEKLEGLISGEGEDK
jgi:hypothetical protein